MDLNEKADMIGRLYLGLEQIEECAEFSALIPEVRTNFVYASRVATRCACSRRKDLRS